MGHTAPGRARGPEARAGSDDLVGLLRGEARPQADLKVGYLSQEPALDDSKDVRGNVEKGVGETMALLEAFNFPLRS